MSILSLSCESQYWLEAGGLNWWEDIPSLLLLMETWLITHSIQNIKVENKQQKRNIFEKSFSRLFIQQPQKGFELCRHSVELHCYITSTEMGKCLKLYNWRFQSFYPDINHFLQKKTYQRFEPQEKWCLASGMSF